MAKQITTNGQCQHRCRILDNAISFFEEIGLNLEGRANVEGEWAGRVTGLGSQCVEIAMMVTRMATAELNFRDFSPLLL